MRSKLDDAKDNVKTLIFENVDKLILPKFCLICGKKTEETYQRTIYRKFIPEKSFRNNYNFSLPICNECQEKIRIKKGFKNRWFKSIPLFLIIGLLIMVEIFRYTYSILIAITSFIISLIIPMILYQSQIKDRIELNNYFDIKLLAGEKDRIQISMTNTEYADFLENINKN